MLVAIKDNKSLKIKNEEILRRRIETDQYLPHILIHLHIHTHPQTNRNQPKAKRDEIIQDLTMIRKKIDKIIKEES